MKAGTLLFIFSLSFLPLRYAQAADRLVTGFPDLPQDARKVAERSLACQHFSGEFGGNGSERDKEVAAQLEALGCGRVIEDLKRMQLKYQRNPEILSILKEVNIE